MYDKSLFFVLFLHYTHCECLSTHDIGILSTIYHTIDRPLSSVIPNTVYKYYHKNVQKWRYKDVQISLHIRYYMYEGITETKKLFKMYYLYITKLNKQKGP